MPTDTHPDRTERLLAPWIAIPLAGVAIVAIEILDYVTGPELDVAFMLLLPVWIVAWNLGLKPGLAACVLAALAEFFEEIFEHITFSHPLIAYWNTFALLVFLAVVCVLLDALHRQFRHQRSLARTDALTGLSNRRAFGEILESEIRRLARYRRPFTLIYLDLDRFKWVNDNKGHAAGDEFLKSVARILRDTFRETDTTARLGGDEFAVILPETGEAPAGVISSNFESELRGLVQGVGYPVSASLGRVTYHRPPASPDAALMEADRRMYRVKKSRK